MRRRTTGRLGVGFATVLAAMALAAPAHAAQDGAPGNSAEAPGHAVGNGANDSGPYDSTSDGSPSGNGNGGGAATGEPCAGCVGNADDKNPPGQLPGPQDGNNGYECDGNHGIGQTNPAHSGCTAAEEPPADDTPGDTGDTPGDTDDTGDTPGDTDDTGDEPPVVVVDPPGDTDDTPGDTDETPGGTDQTPGDEDDTPPVEIEDQSVPPAGDDQTPGGTDETPSDVEDTGTGDPGDTPDGTDPPLEEVSPAHVDPPADTDGTDGTDDGTDAAVVDQPEVASAATQLPHTGAAGTGTLAVLGVGFLLAGVGLRTVTLRAARRS